MTNKNNFTDIYDEFFPKIKKYLIRLLGENEAEDITQIVFEKVNRNLDTLRENQRYQTGYTELPPTLLWTN